MEYKEPTKNPFAQNAFDKAQDAIDHARDVREKKIAEHDKKKAEPHLIVNDNLQRCSLCGYAFPADVKLSMTVAFAEHLLKAHKPGQTSEDVNQAAARIVRDTMKD